jgi:hypothetical protein
MPTEKPMKHLSGRFWWANRREFLFPGLYCGTRRILPLPAPYQPPELIEFSEQRTVIAKDQPEYRPMLAYRFHGDPQGRIVCCWKLNWRDRFKVLATGKLWHSILTFNQPLQPQLIVTDKPEMPKA